MKTLDELVDHLRAPNWPPHTTFYRTLLLVSCLLTLTGCGLFAASDEPEGPVLIRTVYPTFTPTMPPTPVSAQADQPGGVPGESTPVPQGVPQDAIVDASAARAVINGPLVNARSGPGVEFDIIGTVERGVELDIVGVNPDRSWWQVCCVENVEAWVTSEFVDTLGAVDSVPVVGGAPDTVASAPTSADPGPANDAPAAPVTPTALPAPVVSFSLEAQEQFPESSLVRIFLYVYAGNSALEGYSLRVTKNGAELPVSGTSFGGQPAFTWPFQDPRQRFQNLKLEFPDTTPEGVWEVQLIDSTGATVGPAATFTLSANDPEQELYVRYAQR